MQATPQISSGPTSTARRRTEVLRRIVLFAVLTVLALCSPCIALDDLDLAQERIGDHGLRPSFLPRVPLWENYVTTFDTVKGFVWNSSYLAVLNAVLLLLFASMAGYAFARLRFFGSDFAFSLLLSTAMIPGHHLPHSAIHPVP